MTIAPATPAVPPTAIVEYRGRGPFTAVSPLSGQRYAFSGWGARLPVMSVDLEWLAALPPMRRCDPTG